MTSLPVSRATSWLTSCVGSCLLTRRSTASPAWRPTPDQTPSPEPWTTCPSPQHCMERVTSEAMLWPLTWAPPANLLWTPQILHHHHPPPPPPCSSQRWNHFCPSPALSFIFGPTPLCAPSLLDSPLQPSFRFSRTVCVCCFCFIMQCSNPPGLQRGREIFSVLFSCCHCFLHKMNKVNIFYYTELKGIFLHPYEKKWNKNWNKENCNTCSSNLLCWLSTTSAIWIPNYVLTLHKPLVSGVVCSYNGHAVKRPCPIR